MENGPKGSFSEEDLLRNEEKENKFIEAFNALTEEERNVIKYIEFHHSGKEEHKLPRQDELEKSAKEKLAQAGIDTDDLGQYLEAGK